MFFKFIHPRDKEIKKQGNWDNHWSCFFRSPNPKTKNLRNEETKINLLAMFF